MHGGDGTLHKTVTALDRVFGDEPLPPIAILCGGTMNVVATSLAIRERRAVFLQAIIDAARDGRSLETIRRRCLRIGDKLGFLFGNGLPANFLDRVLRRPGDYGPGTRGLAARARLLLGRSGTDRSFASCSSASRARCGSTARCSNGRRSSG